MLGDVDSWVVRVGDDRVGGAVGVVNRADGVNRGFGLLLLLLGLLLLLVVLLVVDTGMFLLLSHTNPH